MTDKNQEATTEKNQEVGYHVAFRRDAIKIIPLSVPEETVAPLEVSARNRRAPHLIYRGGPLLRHVAVTSVYVGSQWRSVRYRALSERLDRFFEFIVASSLIDQLAEYDVGRKTIAHGTFMGPVHIDAPDARYHVSDGWIQTLLVQGTSTRVLPTPTRNSLYFVFLPPGVRVTQGGGASCQAFCGYHDAIQGQIYYAVMPFPGCNGCRHGLEVYDAMTVVSSHELCEAITDPIPGRGWYDELYGEIGDIVAWQTKTIDGYLVQKEWSNTAGAGI